MIYVANLLCLISLNVMLACSLNIVVGYAGLLSLAHGAFYGLGAYGVALAGPHVGFWPALAIGVLISAVVGIALGASTARLSKDYFVLVTFAFQILFVAVITNFFEITGGPSGIANISRPTFLGVQLSSPVALLPLLSSAALLVYCISVKLEFAHFGRTLRAVREDENLVLSLGISSAAHKSLALALGAAIAALSGGLYAGYVTFIDPTSFTFNESLLILTMVIVGGVGNAAGAAVGAILFTVLPEILRLIGIDGTIGGNIRQILFGACLVAVVLWRAEGLMPEEINRRPRWLTIRRHNAPD